MSSDQLTDKADTAFPDAIPEILIVSPGAMNNSKGVRSMAVVQVDPTDRLKTYTPPAIVVPAVSVDATEFQEVIVTPLFPVVPLYGVKDGVPHTVAPILNKRVTV